MKMGTLLSILSLILCLNELMASESDDVALVGLNYTVKCNFEVKYPAWSVVYNTSYHEDITVSGSSTINPNFHAKERTEYDTNRKDLKLSNVTLGDAGRYICSLAAQNSNPAKRSTLNLDVDVFDVKDFECPIGDSGHFYVTTECVTPGPVNVEWFYETKYGDIKIRDILEEKNKGDCSSDKAKITNRGLYTASYNLMTWNVHIKLKLSYLDGNKSEIFKYCTEESYLIAGNCEGVYLSLALVMTTSVTLFICGVCICRKYWHLTPSMFVFNSLLVLSTLLHLTSCILASIGIYDVEKYGWMSIYEPCSPELHTHAKIAALISTLGTVSFGVYVLITHCKRIAKKRDEQSKEAQVFIEI